MVAIKAKVPLFLLFFIVQIATQIDAMTVTDTLPDGHASSPYSPPLSTPLLLRLSHANSNRLLNHRLSLPSSSSSFIIFVVIVIVFVVIVVSVMLGYY